MKSGSAHSEDLSSELREVGPSEIEFARLCFVREVVLADEGSPVASANSVAH